MKTIVIPDIHNRVQWIDPFLEKTSYDQVVFLGDYFDQFCDTEEDAYRTVTWLKGALKNPKAIFLLGNHDLGYMFPKNSQLTDCPGFRWRKCKTIRKVLKASDWNKFKLYHFTNGWLMSHAGIHPRQFGPHVKDVDITLELIQSYSQEAMRCAKENVAHAFFACGDERGGMAEIGGITWLGWTALSPISGWNQIVGHTCFKKPQFICSKGDGHTQSTNWCIDTKNAHVGLLCNGTFEIISTGLPPPELDWTDIPFA